MENCCFNKSIDCTENERKCNCCGWNPDVAKERIKEWKINNKINSTNK